MEDLFKQNLLRLREPQAPKTFTEAILGNAYFSQPKPRPAAAPTAPLTRPEFTEKKQVIESLERFAQEKVALEEKPVIKIPGGEIVVRPTPGWEVPLYSDAQELKDALSLPGETKNIILKDKRPGQVQVLFVTEIFRSFEEASAELAGNFLDELLMGFPLKTAELFGRMIGAMKLTPEEVLLYPIENAESSLASEVMSLAAFYRPQVIVTLGAKASNEILKGNDRLSMIHGQFFTRQVLNAGDFEIVPLFHPSIIESNQNMKKTAWADMQKIMKHLQKLP